MTDRHVIIGAGPVGQATAAELARRGLDVVLASRSGTGPEVPGARRAGVDAADADALTKLTDGAGPAQLRQPAELRHLAHLLAADQRRLPPRLSAPARCWW